MKKRIGILELSPLPFKSLCQPGVQSIVSSVVGNVYPGAIVLLHDGGGRRAQTVTALETVLSELRSQGYVMESLCN